jgi:hypothetical protein
MEEYRALLAAQRARPETDGQEAKSSSIAGGESDVA